jgi:hypothetical protein
VSFAFRARLFRAPRTALGGNRAMTGPGREEADHLGPTGLRLKSSYPQRWAAVTAGSTYGCRLPSGTLWACPQLSEWLTWACSGSQLGLQGPLVGPFRPPDLLSALSSTQKKKGALFFFSSRAASLQCRDCVQFLAVQVFSWSYFLQIITTVHFRPT